MRIVVTGASGFLGRALMRNLAHTGIDVVGVSRRDLPGLVRVDTYEDAPVGEVLVHLAEASDRCRVREHGAACEQATLKVLDALIEKRYDHIVYASSAVLYGDQSESFRCVGDPVHLIDSYTRLKFASEQAVLRKDGVVARLSNIFGPGMADNNVLSKILAQIPGKGPVQVFDTAPVRDFLWVDDAAGALHLMAVSGRSGLYNVGTGTGTSVAELARMMLEAAGEENRPVISTRPGNRLSVNILDISATTADFGWKPRTDLREGIRHMVRTRTGGARE